MRYFLALWFLTAVPLLAQSERAALLSGANRIRAEHDLGPLQRDARLDAYAQEWAEHLAEIGKLEHRSGRMLDLFLTVNGARLLNENLHYSWGFTTPLLALDGWMKSPPHRRNLLEEKITHAGFGFATRPKGNQTQIFVVFNGAAF
jgi:uncharacterized protein YkwD